MICNQISWNTGTTDLANAIATKFPSLFSKELGLCNKTKVQLQLLPESKRIFRKSRPVPFAACAAIEEEILRLQHLGIFTPVSYAEFAAPIVVVKRKNTGKVRICGHYSTGLNNVLVPNKFPLPTPDNIFTSLTGKIIISKIDFSDAFLQLELEEESKKLLTVNTHIGLFQVNRMQQIVPRCCKLLRKIRKKYQQFARTTR